MDWPSQWNTDRVRAWLCRQGFEDYAELLTQTHKVDGQALLLLSENDLRSPPLSLKCLGDIKRLHRQIDALRRQHGIHSPVEYPPDDAYDEVLVVGPQNGSLPFSPAPVEHRRSSSRGSRGWEAQNVYYCGFTKNFWITLLAFLYCQLSLLVTAFVMTIVHDRVPDMKTYPPLPDLFLDNVPVIPWAFQLCETIVCVMGISWSIILIFHKHKLIIFRRMFSLMGTVFLLRCVTMLITSLSVPGMHLECSGRLYGDMWLKARKAFEIWFGLGMSLRGVRSCGDYMFSGHTVVITLLNHFISEYTPESWVQIHTASWVGNLFGIFFILAAHEHYSIDVFVAFYISSRLFLYYHQMAYNAEHLIASNQIMRTRTWFPLFWLFEMQGGIGRIDNEYEWPLPAPNVILEWLRRVISTDTLTPVRNSMNSVRNLMTINHSPPRDVSEVRDPSIGDSSSNGSRKNNRRKSNKGKKS